MSYLQFIKEKLYYFASRLLFW